MDSGEETEQEAGPERKDKGEEDGDRAEGGADGVAGVRGEERDDDLVGRVGNEQAGQAGENREDERLRKKLNDELSAGGPEGKADGELLSSIGRTGEEEVSDIGAGDEEDEGRDGEEEEEGGAGVAEDVALALRTGDERHRLVDEALAEAVAGSSLQGEFHAFKDGFEVAIYAGLGLFEGHAGLEAGKEIDPVISAIGKAFPAGGEGFSEADGDEDFRCGTEGGAAEIAGRDADD